MNSVRKPLVLFVHCTYTRSLLSLLSYLGSGKCRPRYLGVKIPPTNIQDHHLQAAWTFADGLAERLVEGPGHLETPALA